MKRHIALIRDMSPGLFGDLLVSALNQSYYNARHRGTYATWRQYFEKFAMARREELQEEQLRRLREFLKHCREHSPFYSRRLRNCNLSVFSLLDLQKLPILEKADLLERLNEIATIDRSKAIISMTGGTTGNSMKVFYAPEDIQERFAFVDAFRADYGYVLGKRIAWSTGKELVSKLDCLFGRYHKSDFLNRIRFFSTFHLNESTFPEYWRALSRFRPEYLLGFPSFYHDLAVYALRKGLKFVGVKAYFPTAETVTEIHRSTIRKVFDCQIIDQYASSEGAPFIIQCPHGGYHLQPHTGVFEVVDDDLRPSKSGELLVTSFSTRGTPLLRYRVGDSVSLDDSGRTCSCGFGGDLVAAIEGRKADVVVTPSGARISSVNFSNSIKYVSGVSRFQVQQSNVHEIQVLIVCNEEFDALQERKWQSAIRERVGNDVSIVMRRVEEIPREKGGKFRVVKSSISNLV